MNHRSPNILHLSRKRISQAFLQTSVTTSTTSQPQVCPVLETNTQKYYKGSINTCSEIVRNIVLNSEKYERCVYECVMLFFVLCIFKYPIFFFKPRSIIILYLATTDENLNAIKLATSWEEPAVCCYRLNNHLSGRKTSICSMSQLLCLTWPFSSYPCDITAL